MRKFQSLGSHVHPVSTVNKQKIIYGLKSPRILDFKICVNFMAFARLQPEKLKNIIYRLKTPIILEQKMWKFHSLATYFRSKPEIKRKLFID